MRWRWKLAVGRGKIGAVDGFVGAVEDRWTMGGTGIVVEEEEAERGLGSAADDDAKEPPWRNFR